jgi:ADP-ribose pyrophosphatase YjhB (NUDIX family)
MSRKSPPKEHGLAVAWYRKDGDIFMLVGTESVYSSHKAIPDIKDSKEKVSAIVASLPAKARYVGRNFDKASRMFKSYTIQRVTADSKKGFPKGGMTGQDKGDVKNTAKREFQEEVGFELNKGKLVAQGKHGGSHIFTYEVTAEEKDGIERAIKKMEEDRKGELFDVKFLKVTDIEKELAHYNATSRTAFNHVLSVVAAKGEVAAEGAKYVPLHKRGKSGGANTTRKQLRKRAKHQTRNKVWRS